MQEICQRVGYEDPAFFRTLFKRHTGMTPAEYRARFAPLQSGRGTLAPAAPIKGRARLTTLGCMPPQRGAGAPNKRPTLGGRAFGFVRPWR